MKQFVVIGLGSFGISLAKTLYEMGNDVLVIDKDEELVQSMAGLVTHAVRADATDENVLKSLGVKNFDVAIVAIGKNMESSIMITMLVKEMGVKYVIAKAHNELHARVLYKVGADRVVMPEKDMGIRVARNIFSSNLLDLIEFSKDYSIAEILPIEEWFHKTLKEIRMRERYGLNVIAAKKMNNEIIVSPGPDYVVDEGDILAVCGKNIDIKKFEIKM
ncbi:trk system potassium uptake protein TrkA [Caldanaerobacter subterraneus subsp. tengcongensis MB4]|uniref:K+ transport systems, NAD-binding component n=1 Tax=Caldanaerobacter subterraneus subsp. tengcongensis (strain DSM 15242 / JCM 11007 / NBRC 100824 / MB4) TaxID=273068 RepID=Q8RD50_CALS4|nr:TrkA family potassium uptake protein [Caldanaerobacter subterraneus]AAM23498.1 K+ transport systems, NAD-binding component [Caldanaerobacter subterraneus subsp. tengcongensis MB4]MCS3917022.1 trk system potassium uptake protein TrkA [Caldanaerobacter subterraneus subsp. tengcongensis MB4]